MTLEERIAYCEKCQLRKHTEDEWIVCSLTDELPTFEPFCDHFQLDEYEARSIEVFRTDNTTGIGNAKHHRRDEKLMAGGLYLGLLLVFISVILALVLHMNGLNFFKIPVGLFFIGGVAIARDLLQDRK